MLDLGDVLSEGCQAWPLDYKIRDNVTSMAEETKICVGVVYAVFVGVVIGDDCSGDEMYSPT